MHGRRQFVVWIVPFSGVTNATLVVCYKCHTRLPSLKFTNFIFIYAMHFIRICLRVLGWEEGEDDARSACPFDILGYTHNTMVGTTRRNGATRSKPFKTGLSSDRSLQLDFLKLESLVIAGQTYCGEYVLKSCTHRPSTQGSQEYPISHHVWDYGKLGNRE
jgi:hypothetical protein